MKKNNIIVYNHGIIINIDEIIYVGTEDGDVKTVKIFFKGIQGAFKIVFDTATESSKFLTDIATRLKAIYVDVNKGEE